MTIDKRANDTAPRPASIADVAKRAGVSVPTVSRVLTGAARVSPERHQQVLRAIEELDYRPSETARALVSGRPRTIAVLTSDTAIYGYSTTIRGIENAARRAGYSLAIAVIANDDDDSVRLSVEAALRQPLAGALVLKFDPAGVRALAAMPAWLPVIAVSGLPDEHRPHALLDEAAGGLALTRHLLDLGHRTVHHVTVPPSRDEDSRTTGWRTALLEAHAPVPPLIPATWDAKSGVAVGRQLASRPEVTAVFCGNDEIAMGVIAGLTDAGRDVPTTISVAGFDDHPLASIWRPGLTTVAQDFDDLGERAFRLLERQLDGDPTVTDSTALPHLVIRASTAAPPSRR